MKIAIDYDGTFTAIPQQISGFVRELKYAGHDVRFVTMRYPYESMGIDKAARMLNIPIVYTSRQQKRNHWDADIWLDDFPEAIARNDNEVLQDKEAGDE